MAFFEREYPELGGSEWLAESHEEFWGALNEETGERLIWLVPNCSSELTAYLAYLDRFADVPAQVIRPSDYFEPHPVYGPYLSLGSMNPEQLAEAFDAAPRRSIEEDHELFGRWRELVEENAMLRVLQDGALVSAPISYFDRFILAAAPSDWTRSIKVVGNALSAAFDEQVPVNSDLLFSRLAALVGSGQLEAQGNVLGWTDEPKREPALVRKPG